MTVDRLELWGGIECTINRVNDKWFDQNARNGHAQREDDLDLIASLGVKKFRYPVLWETAQQGNQEVFDFSWAARRLVRLEELGIEPIAGLLHHGSGPPNTSLIDPQFPEKFARYARAVAERFPQLIDYTPINEPLTTARFSGLYGVWYPHGKDNRTFLKALVNECRATVLAMREIRAVNASARLIQTDDMGRATGTAPCQAQVDFENERRWLGFDLLFGSVNPTHPLWCWLLDNGVERATLEWFLENLCAPDVVGINHYPLSNRYLDHRIEIYPDCFHCFREARPYADLGAPQARGHLHESERPDLILPEDILRDVCARYQCPVAVTEVHVDGPREAQIQWLNEVWEAAQRVRSDGLNVCAVTVWSLLGSFDWNCLCSECHMYYEPGVFDIRGGTPRPTAIASVARSLATEGRCEHPLGRKSGPWRSGERVRVNTPPVLIVGAGTLGKAFGREAHRRGLDYELLRRSQVDLASLKDVRAALRHTRPLAVVNAAGFARVNEAELRPYQAFRDNALGSEILASECRRLGIPVMVFSSHLVFDGTKSAEGASPYVETDDPRALNVYGRTKIDMERRVAGVHTESLIVRAGSFISPWNAEDFIVRALRTLRAGLPVYASDDALISPAYLPDLVNACLDLLVDGLYGLIHLASEGAVSRAQLALSAAEFLRVNPELVQRPPHPPAAMQARRPPYSVLRSARLVKVMPPLADALERNWHALGRERLAA